MDIKTIVLTPFLIGMFASVSAEQNRGVVIDNPQENFNVGAGSSKMKV